MVEKQGQTTQQLINAPRFAYFVWGNEHIAYVRDLARHTGRSDLNIITPSYAFLIWYHLRSYRPGVVYDHNVSSETIAYIEHRADGNEDSKV